MKNKQYYLFLFFLIHSIFVFGQRNNQTNELIGKWKFSNVSIDRIDKKRFSFPGDYIEDIKNKTLIACDKQDIQVLEFKKDSSLTINCSDSLTIIYHWEIKDNELWLYKSDYVIVLKYKITKDELIFTADEVGLRKRIYYKKENKYYR